MLRVALCALCLFLPLILHAAEVRTFREANGRTHTGTFQKVQGDKVHVRVRNKTSQLSFWSLSKADQVYVLEQVKSDPLATATLKPAEDPREWTDTRGNKTAARFIEVKSGATIAIVVDGNRVEFAFANFSKADQDYIRNQVRGTPAEQHLPQEVAQGGAVNPTIPMSQTTLPGVPVSALPSNPTAIANPGIPGFPMPNTAPNPVAGHVAVPSSTPGFPMTPPSGNPTPNYVPPTSNNFAPAPNNIGSSTTSMPNPSTPASAMHSPAPPSNMAPTPSAPPPNPFNRVNPVPGTDSVAVYTCSNCKKEVSSIATRCPHCHVSFDYVEDENGNRTTTGTGMARNGLLALRVAIFIVIPGLIWLGKKLMGRE